MVKRENSKARKTDWEKNDDETRWRVSLREEKKNILFLVPEEIVGVDDNNDNDDEEKKRRPGAAKPPNQGFAEGLNWSGQG